jgi:Rieske Fe-S protein
MSQPIDPYEPPPPTSPERRRVLQWCAIGLGALATFFLGIPIIGYVLGTLIKRQPDDWVDLGELKKFPKNQTILRDFELPVSQAWDGQARNASAYVRQRGDGSFVVFAINCAHLGCPVSWFPSSGLFMCPCHGGVYYEDGSRASGPPPRGLYEYETRFVQGKPSKVVPPEEYDRMKEEQRRLLRLEIKAGHVPTLHDELRPPVKGKKA